MKTDSGHEVVDVDPEIRKRLSENFEGFAKFGVKMVTPGNFYGTDQLAININKLYHFKVRPGDVYACSYLKVGSTWLKEVIWTILHNKDLNHPHQDEDAFSKAPWLETEVMLTTEQIPLALASKIPPGYTFFDILAALPDARVFQTHIPFAYLNPNTLDKAKAVYIIRDPRDVCLSYFHFTRNVTFYGYTKSFETFVDDFIDGALFSGSYLDHLRQWWPVRNNPNVYTVYYENIRKNGPIEIKKLAEFLGVELNEKQIANVIHFTSMEEMKKRDIVAKNEEANKEFLKSGDKAGMFRKGEIGSSAYEMTPKLYEKVSQYFRKNLCEIELPYDFNVKN